ncbi:hypothetical protein PMAA_077830 [Talaromyces marneffei ATCC 18224]|uniref:Uncharacterized protein n=1 Tax=Talaromyces marneffei (strain ATCC 18224 / CBS 334.59 / QM 7333) TaxID=441960 RepID=B6QDA2_TALMQ|nr:hypothetical protein PMAA_077830 [Talaromyces marneffei ATCC 18224]
MAQIQAFGLRIDMGFSSGQLSLHEYRKFLSRQDNSKMSPTSPRPRLKRKPAALDLCQKSHHDLGFQLQSPVSSAPSSPPPLSFSKSVISLPGGDLPTPISPISIDPFSARLKKPTQDLASHSRTSSGSTLPSTSAPAFKVKHNGAEFEILNPKSHSSFQFSDNSTYRLSSLLKDMMEEGSPDVSPTHSFISYAIPDDMIRPLSASESAILSEYTSPALSPGLSQSSYSFGALPPLRDVPSSPVSPRSPRTPASTLKQKVSRLFGSSDKHSSPRQEIDLHEKYDHDDYHNERNTPRSPLSNHWETGESVKPVHQPEITAKTTSSEENQDSSHHEELSSRRRPTWGPHSSNRHHTLQDALRQLEPDNNGLGFEDIMRYIDAENGDGIETVEVSDGPLDEKVERPWQPDTWNEPTLVRMPHNRPSDSNLSTNAPSTRASIRPYVERAAAFMAGGGDAFSESSLSDLDEGKHETLNVKVGREKENEEDIKTEDDGEPTVPLRRSISRRARPLSSNPPDLDTPLLFDSSSSSLSLASDTRATPTPPHPTYTLQPMTRISWSPEIPARHPDHRIVRFGDDLATTPAINHRADMAPPPLAPTTATQSAAPRVVTTTTIAPGKKVKKHSSGCHCL